MGNYCGSEAKKGNGIEDLISQLDPQPVDDIKVVSPGGQSQFQDLLAKHSRFLGKNIKATGGIFSWYTAMEKAVEKHFPEQLTPAEINIFLQLTIQIEDQPNYESRTNYIVSRLIQNSYQSGYNDFALSTALHREKLAPWRLRGTPERPLRMTLDGDAGCTSFAFCRYVEGKITGNASACGAGSSDSSYIIEGNDQGELGWAYFDDGLSADGTEHCHFTVRGTVGEKSGLYSSACTFRVFTREAAEQLRSTVSQGNKVILVFPNGREYVIKKNKKPAK